ncbi:MAG: hypothetical protein PHT62_06810 [Desulfotomaculaceae bacterium]|nr:hypothetical protein [Desulfotomaculaceae bacterium]
MRIGVDIDGVLADSLPLWVKELNNYFKKNMSLQEIQLQDISRTYGITGEELLDFLHDRGRFLMTSPLPLDGASYYLNQIKKSHDVFIVSARHERFGGETRDWLHKNSLPYDEILLLGSHDKREACLTNDLNVLIEDTLKISVEVSAAGVPVLLMDAPYNQGVLPGLVYRTHSWQDIYRTIADEPHWFDKTVLKELRF